MKKTQKAIVIIPTYNEKGNIEQTTLAVQDAFKKASKNWDCHILVVDDTSPDKTYEFVKELQKKQKNLHLLINKKKAGLGAAYLAGMKHAFYKLNADVIFEFDADLSHDPTKIPAFLAKVDEGYDMVLGSRYIKGGSIPDNWGIHRKFLSVIGNLIIRIILTNFSIADWTGGYRAITKKVFMAVEDEMNDPRFTGYTFQVVFLHKVFKKKFKITEIPFHFKDRTVGISKISSFKTIINNLIYLFKVRIQEIIEHRVFKFLVVGTLGALSQLTSLQLFRLILPYQVAYFAAIEIAVLVNFSINNVWTFADRKLKLVQIPSKFIQFNLASGGSILIQQFLAFIGEKLFAYYEAGQTYFPILFKLPIINYNLDMGTMIAVVGILVGMFWNFFAYNTFIWKKKKN